MCIRDSQLTAQNASDTATISLEIYDQETNQLVESDEAGNMYGVASSYKW